MAIAFHIDDLTSYTNCQLSRGLRELRLEKICGRMGLDTKHENLDSVPECVDVGGAVSPKFET